MPRQGDQSQTEEADEELSRDSGPSQIAPRTSATVNQGSTYHSSTRPVNPFVFAPGTQASRLDNALLRDPNMPNSTLHSGGPGSWYAFSAQSGPQPNLMAPSRPRMFDQPPAQAIPPSWAQITGRTPGQSYVPPMSTFQQDHPFLYSVLDQSRIGAQRPLAPSLSDNNPAAAFRYNPYGPLPNWDSTQTGGKRRKKDFLTISYSDPSGSLFGPPEFRITENRKPDWLKLQAEINSIVTNSKEEYSRLFPDRSEHEPLPLNWAGISYKYDNPDGATLTRGLVRPGDVPRMIDIFNQAKGLRTTKSVGRRRGYQRSQRGSGSSVRSGSLPSTTATDVAGPNAVTAWASGVPKPGLVSSAASITSIAEGPESGDEVYFEMGSQAGTPKDKSS
ncbi:hypothetical protein I302_100976 [Kwoniella bestiolae CBS 10118]|uniref:Uncharacterized protein n=1 Tax=Kwoniella bestiolae CBS 10118 TaxID=1296100 RepID=A0A1B9G6K9_9TREE|nr:hypothetical protein I302_04353 [Kwoniella bestiolae CBS 10118]OCF26666.1 hypothetical protein I302_04353 [Kwoniella bestiolae CBS 10118]